ncbi:uncharacterized protein C3orf85 homolog [Melospiza melodia melodia]|uniref:uncharacterized protein C3orf85 homolog n=1 Tax=Melospiza melodia melodia TaxID=1914991 RepID=UPI002FCFF179
MARKMFQILVSALLFTASVSSVLGAPFLTEESVNQFLRLKRHVPYSPSYWDSGSSQNTWAHTVAQQISESWAALRETAKYYMDLDPYAFDPSTAGNNIRSYMEHLQQSETHLQQQAIKSYTSCIWPCYGVLCICHYVFDKMTISPPTWV